MELRIARAFALGLLLLGTLSHGAPPHKKKGKAAPAQAPSELKAAPPVAPVAETLPEPAAPPPPSRPSPAPPSPAAPAPAPEVAAEPELAPLVNVTRLDSWSIQAVGGVVVPFSTLGVGGRAELRVARWLGAVPLGASLGVAFEQHTSRGAVTFAPPAGGLDEATLDNQTLLPIELALLASPWRDEQNRLHLGASYGLLAVWSETIALGSTALERGVGHEVAAEAGYTRRVGALELTLKLRYSVRRTAVGPRTSTIELPWYQTFGVVAGLGFWR